MYICTYLQKLGKYDVGQAWICILSDESRCDLLFDKMNSGVHYLYA
jgi:hypothetical protein